MSRVLLTVLACAALIFVACSDPENPKTITAPAQTFRDLSERAHVLHNLEASYNQRNLAEYDKLIDENFTFFFSAEDFSSGRTPETWDRSTDVPATQRLLTDGLTIDLDLQIDTLEWTPVTPDSFPKETWFMTTTNYTFTMRFSADPATTFITSGQPQAQFTVREVDVDGQKRWRLVKWSDLAQAN